MLNPGMIWPLKVLVVEDDLTNRYMMAKILARFVEKVEEAVDGTDALARINGFQPDLIITDLSMPNMDGLTLVKTLRDTGCSTPVIILSAHNEDHILQQAQQSGILGFLTKPIKLDKIIESLETLAAKNQVNPIRKNRQST